MWEYEGVARVTRAESKERTRQRLLAEAQRLFRERGYAATSLEQIADAAEVTKGAIYGHFASKEDLMLTAMEAAPPLITRARCTTSPGRCTSGWRNSAAPSPRKTPATRRNWR